MKRISKRHGWFRRASSTFTAVLLCVLALVPRAGAQPTQTATIKIDASRVENRVDPLLYGQFLEFMYEGIKSGLHAELIRNRSFEEPANVLGLSRYWEQYPDNRNDDYALSPTMTGKSLPSSGPPDGHETYGMLY